MEPGVPDTCSKLKQISWSWPARQGFPRHCWKCVWRGVCFVLWLRLNHKRFVLNQTEKLIFALLLLLLLCARKSRAQEVDAPFRPNQILVAPKPNRAADTLAMHRGRGRRVLKQFPETRNVQVVELAPGEDVRAAIKEYEASGAVDYAEPDYILKISITPNDPYYSAGYQWDLNNPSSVSGFPEADIDAPEGWEIRHDASNVIVAIVDSGVRQTHEDLAPNLWTNTKEIPGNGIDDDGNGYIDDVHGINAIVGGGNVEDDAGHGTHVAGIIGASGNNGKGIAGVAWNVQLMPLKFIAANGRGNTSDAVECVNYAVKNGAKVINASFGGGDISATFQTALQNARNAGVIFLAAAGNESTNNDATPSYPANYAVDNVVSVCATTSDDRFESLYSNFGATTVDLGAPGTSIFSCYTNSNGAYTYLSGTSMATPVVAGVVALMRAQFPTDTYAQIIGRLLGTVDPLPTLAGKCVTGGRVNLRKALSPFVSAAFTPSALAGAFPLTVRFTNQSFGEITTYSWDFGDGSPPSTDASPTHVFATEGKFPVKLTVVGAGGIQAAKSQNISAVSGYTFGAAPFEWIDPTSMTRLSLADNSVSAAQSIGFDFDFYGETKTEIYVGSNGLLGFGTINLITTVNLDLPSAATPNGIICPYWDNLNPATAGSVYAGVIGQAPNRRFVASWVGVSRNSSSDKMTFQAVLSETTGFVQFNYLEVHPTSSRGGGTGATIGVEDSTGTLATKYTFDGTPNRVANSQSIVFLPSAVRGETKFNPPSIENGVVKLNYAAYVGQSFLIEGSNDLIVWTEVQRGTVGASGIVSLAEPISGTRFFRAQILR